MSLPTDLIKVIKTKVESERQSHVINIFTEYIIPFIYLIQLPNDWIEYEMAVSYFDLIRLGRVCSSLHSEINKGSPEGVIDILEYASIQSRLNRWRRPKPNRSFFH
uniref:Uncharacterized protein n=1 Tax=Clandestinovirus TaxID=2831644 RepID=A0A8F8KLP8_9VIRU|nr:hypothetical protein KOM_12_147 [Clandestinovirus]